MATNGSDEYDGQEYRFYSASLRFQEKALHLSLCLCLVLPPPISPIPGSVECRSPKKNDTRSYTLTTVNLEISVAAFQSCSLCAVQVLDLEEEFQPIVKDGKTHARAHKERERRH